MLITEFLEARIAEDEDAARDGGSHNYGGVFARDNYGRLLVQPTRVLAECAAKRAIVELADYVETMDYQITDEWGGDLEGTGDAILFALAAVYADHPNYQPEWKP